MAASIEHVLSQIQRWTSSRLEDLSDAVLLERFVQRRDESAFATLVARHGTMVLHSCRRVLGDAHEAEDALQATFLILARKAHTLRQPAALPGFLHSVARRVALKARTKAKVRAGQMPLPEKLPDASTDPLAQLSARELLTVLDEEVAYLSMPQRSAVVLCCLEGHTQEEAARLLGWTAGSLKGHLERGRHRLQSRLRRRGIALSAALALVAVSRGEAATALLLRSTVTAALGGGIGGSSATLADSVLKAMLLGKLAGAMAMVLSIVLAASATVALVYRGSSAETPEDKKPVVSTVPREADAGKPKVRTDALGDPLPDGALRRLGTLRFRHGGGIHNLLLPPNGKTLVSNDYYGTETVCVWDLATGKLLRQFPGTYGENNIALSPDGKLVAIGQKKAILLWDLASGREVRKLAQPGATGVAFSPDGKLLAAGGDFPGIHVWDVGAGKRIARWASETNGNVLLTFTADGKTLIAGQAFHSKIGLWDVASGKKRQELDAKTGALFSFMLSPEGAILATGSRQGGIPLWNVKTGELIRKLGKEGGRECYNVAFSPNGKTLAAIERDAKNQDSLSLWDVADGKELHRFMADVGLWAIAYSRDGKTLIAASGSAIRLLDAATGKEVGPTAGFPVLVGFVTRSPDGRTLAYYQENAIRFWDMRASREIGSIPVRPHGIQSLAFAPDGRTVAASVGEHAVNLWDVRSRKLLHRLQWDKKESPHAYWAYAVAFSPDGRVLVSADAKDSFVRLWDAAAGKQIRRLTMNVPGSLENRWIEPNVVAFSPDGKLLAASGRTGYGGSKVRIWQVATGKDLPQLTRAMNDPADGDEQDFNGSPLVFSPNGSMIAKNGRPKTISFWETATGQQRLVLRGHDASTVCVAFAPDGRTLASASWDETIRLWNLDTGRELRKLTGHRGKANSLAFSADGKILVSAGDDTTILFWDVADVTHRKSPHAAPLAKQEWQALWEDLAKDDAAKAYAAMVRMAADGPTTIAALKERLRTVRPVDRTRLARLLQELDSDEFAVREAANRELEKLDDGIRPAMREALARPGLSLEPRRRLQALSASLDEISAARLRSLRAIEVLELIGTREAREVLKTLAAGAKEARLTEQAKAALERLARR